MVSKCFCAMARDLSSTGRSRGCPAFPQAEIIGPVSRATAQNGVAADNTQPATAPSVHASVLQPPVPVPRRHTRVAVKLALEVEQHARAVAEEGGETVGLHATEALVRNSHDDGVHAISAIWPTIWPPISTGTMPPPVARPNRPVPTDLPSSRQNLPLPPHHPVHDADVALHDAHDLVAHVLVRVVGHGDAEVAVGDHPHGELHRLQQADRVDAGEHEAPLVHSLGPLGGGADAHGGDGIPTER